MTQHCTITGTMLVPVHYIICTLKIVCFPEITVFVVVKINSFQCQYKIFNICPRKKRKVFWNIQKSTNLLSHHTLTSDRGDWGDFGHLF